MPSAALNAEPPSESTISQNGPCGLAAPRSRPSTTRPPHHSATAARYSSRRTWPQTCAPAADGELAGEMPDPARGAVDQHLAAEQQPALAQRVQRGQPGDRQCRGLRIADPVRQNRDRMAAAIDPLGPGARRQDADDPRAGLGAAAVRRLGLDHAGEIPPRPPARLGLGQRPPVSPRFSEIAVTRTATSSRSGSRNSTGRIASLPGARDRRRRLGSVAASDLRGFIRPVPWRLRRSILPS